MRLEEAERLARRLAEAVRVREAAAEAKRAAKADMKAARNARRRASLHSIAAINECLRLEAKQNCAGMLSLRVLARRAKELKLKPGEVWDWLAGCW